MSCKLKFEILVKCMQIVLYSPLIVSDKKMLNNDEILLLMAAGAVVHQFIAVVGRYREDAANMKKKLCG
jgi:hypothetical protein